MMSRQEQKQKTRELIINVTRERFAQNGILNTSTIDLAKAAGIANGTIFLHFTSRENLLVEVFSLESKKIAAAIYSKFTGEMPAPDVFDNLVEHIALDEDFFGSVYRELPLLSPDIQNRIISFQLIMRNVLFRALQKELPADEITVVIDAAFALIEYYLRMKPILINEGSILQKYKLQIHKAFQRLIK